MLNLLVYKRVAQVNLVGFKQVKQVSLLAFRPLVQVSWDDAGRFLGELNRRRAIGVSGAFGRGVRSNGSIRWVLVEPDDEVETGAPLVVIEWS